MGVQPQLYADNLKCLSRDLDLLLAAARFTTGYVRLVGQEPAPCKCVLLSTSREVRHDMSTWVLSQEGDQWSVKFDVRDLGGHLDTTFRSWSSTLSARVRFVISRLVLQVGLGSFGLRIFLLHFMALKHLFLPLVACVGFVLLFVGWFGLIDNLWLMLVLFLAFWMVLLVVILFFV